MHARTKVCDLDVEVGVQEEVLRLEVAMDYALGVAILHRAHNLECVNTRVSR